MTIQSVLDEVGRLDDAITRSAPGAPELSDIISRIRELQEEVERIRSLQNPLVPDANSPPPPDEIAAKDLGRALASLLQAASSKSETDGTVS